MYKVFVNNTLYLCIVIIYSQMYRHLRQNLIQMKPSKLVILTTVFGLFLFITSCGNSAQKVEKAEENVVEAEENLQEAQDEYKADIEQFRLMTNEKIAANERAIAEYNAKLAKEKKTMSAEIKEEIAALEVKNNNLKMKIGEYTDNGKENWEAFKTEFGKDMDDLGTSISNIGKKNQ